MPDMSGINLSAKNRIANNRILKNLPTEELDFLQPKLEKVHLSFGDIVYQADDAIRYIYFPNTGMISLLSVTEQGQAIEIGYSGYEGLVGIPVFLGQNEMPYQALAQAQTECLRIEAKTAVELFNRRGVFHNEVLRYLYVILKQISQTCICNHYHKIEGRLCRWLSVMFERSGNKKLLLTQEFLAHMLGVQRTSIGMIAGALQSAEIIRYSRGTIEILDYEKLKKSACECYEIIRKEQSELLDEKDFSAMSDT